MMREKSFKKRSSGAGEKNICCTNKKSDTHAWQQPQHWGKQGRSVGLADCQPAEKSKLQIHGKRLVSKRTKWRLIGEDPLKPPYVMEKCTPNLSLSFTHTQTHIYTHRHIFKTKTKIQIKSRKRGSHHKKRKANCRPLFFMNIYAHICILSSEMYKKDNIS